MKIKIQPAGKVVLALLALAALHLIFSTTGFYRLFYKDTPSQVKKKIPQVAQSTFTPTVSGEGRPELRTANQPTPVPLPSANMTSPATQPITSPPQGGTTSKSVLAQPISPSTSVTTPISRPVTIPPQGGETITPVRAQTPPPAASATASSTHPETTLSQRGIPPMSDQGQPLGTKGSLKMMSPELTNTLIGPQKVTVFFRPNGIELEEEEKATIDQLVSKVEKQRVVTIRITGYADVDGSQLYNNYISRQRAHSVLFYMMGRFGFKRGLFRVNAQGSTTSTPAGDQKSMMRFNRRVTIVIETNS